MKNIILIGAGGHCVSCIDVIERSGKYRILGIIDNEKKTGEKVLGYPIIGNDSSISELRKKCGCFLIAIGQIKTPAPRKRFFLLLKRLKILLPAIISKDAYVSRHARIGEGSIVMNRAVVNAGVSIGKNCIINTGAIIEHDTLVSDHCHIATGAVVCGGVDIGQDVFIGANATIKEKITISSGTIVGCQTSVLKNIASGEEWKNEQGCVCCAASRR